jgi:regulatory protein
MKLENIDSVITRFLSRREHSEYEMVNKLLQRGYDSADVDLAITKFKNADILSDSRFAESRIRDRAYKGYGEFWITQELKQHQLSAQTIETALAEEPQDWFEIAKHWVCKKYSRKADMAKIDWKMQQKMKVSARNRGFSQDEIRYAMDCFFDEQADDNQGML